MLVLSGATENCVDDEFVPKLKGNNLKLKFTVLDETTKTVATGKQSYFELKLGSCLVSSSTRLGQRMK